MIRKRKVLNQVFWWPIVSLEASDSLAREIPLLVLKEKEGMAHLHPHFVPFGLNHYGCWAKQACPGKGNPWNGQYLAISSAYKHGDVMWSDPCYWLNLLYVVGRVRSPSNPHRLARHASVQIHSHNSSEISLLPSTLLHFYQPFSVQTTLTIIP